MEIAQLKANNCSKDLTTLLIAKPLTKHPFTNLLRSIMVIRLNRKSIQLLLRNPIILERGLALKVLPLALE